MKKFSILLLFFMTGFAISGWAQKAIPASDLIKLSKEKYDIGKVKQNESSTFYMEFTNVSRSPVIVENVMAGCGCTVPEKPQAPIMPGKTGKLKVAYNGVAKGKFTKDVTIKLKGADPVTVYFTGEVI